MRFSEQQKDGKWIYTTWDDEVFGKMTFETLEKLTAEQLDLLVSHCLKVQLKKGEVKFEISKKKFALVKFIFRKKSDWGEEEKIKITLTKNEQ